MSLRRKIKDDKLEVRAVSLIQHSPRRLHVSGIQLEGGDKTLVNDAREWLCENISKVICGGNVLDFNIAFCNLFTDVMVSNVDMLSARMTLRILGECNRRHVVAKQS